MTKRTCGTTIHIRARVMARTVANYLGITRTVLLNCPIKAEIRAFDSQFRFENFVIVMINNLMRLSMI